MKTIFYTCMLVLTYHTMVTAQVINDSVSINPGYTNQTFYSIGNGTKNSVSNSNWDIAFEINGQTASILINSKSMVTLYRPVDAVANWTSISYADTLANMVMGNELFNHDTSWGMGAFNRTFNQADPFDLGWGNYNFATHQVIGDSVYFIRLSNGLVKKIYIESLTSGIYTFKYANPDGTNEITASIDKLDYVGKNFGYYSLVNDIGIDREPLNTDWDLLFTQYLSVTPITYMVTGVLSNKNVLVEKAYPVDVSNVTYNQTQFSHFTNTIGYNWKYFDLNTFSWVIEDSTVFFVRDVNFNIYKWIFNGFDGSSNGMFRFAKEFLALGAEETPLPIVLEVFPNPVSNYIQYSLYNQTTSQPYRIILSDMSGKTIINEIRNTNAPFTQGKLDLNSLKNGIYLLRIEGTQTPLMQKIVISK